jgi:tetratricopeptide (TPR) repeat protein
MLGRVNVEASDCSRAADRESIHKSIRDSVGFGKLGRMVFGVMEQWMVGELRARATAKREEGDEREGMVWSLAIGTLPNRQGNNSEAVYFQEHALAIARRVLGEDAEELRTCMNNLALTYGDLGRHQDALAMWESALEFRRRVLPPNHPDIAASAFNISLSLEQAGDIPRAARCAREAAVIWRAALPANHPHLQLADTRVSELESCCDRARND